MFNLFLCKPKFDFFTTVNQAQTIKRYYLTEPLNSYNDTFWYLEAKPTENPAINGIDLFLVHVSKIYSYDKITYSTLGERKLWYTYFSPYLFGNSSIGADYECFKLNKHFNNIAECDQYICRELANEIKIYTKELDDISVVTKTLDGWRRKNDDTCYKTYEEAITIKDYRLPSYMYNNATVRCYTFLDYMANTYPSCQLKNIEHHNEIYDLCNQETLDIFFIGKQSCTAERLKYILTHNPDFTSINELELRKYRVSY